MTSTSTVTQQRTGWGNAVFFAIIAAIVLGVAADDMRDTSTGQFTCRIVSLGSGTSTVQCSEAP